MTVNILNCVLAVFIAGSVVTLAQATTEGPTGANSQAEAEKRDALADGQLSFSVDIQDQTIDLSHFFATVMPGEMLQVKVNVRPNTPAFFFTASNVEMATGPHAASVIAPDTPGLYALTIESPKSDEVMSIAVFVLEPHDQSREMTSEGYKIGAYPEEPLRGNPIYLPPPGLIRLESGTAQTKISPHFTIGEFLCKQQPNAVVKYLLVRPALVYKLERIRRALDEDGVVNPSISIMSGYRTPWYNERIGNVAYSRHVWGGAADIFIDRNPKDGVMDDLTGDGQVTRADAAWLYDFINDLSVENDGQIRRGGIGEYGPASHRGPFVHVDVRGTPARWGR